MKKVSQKIFKECFKLKKSEKVLIITDKNKLEIAQTLFETANIIAKECLILQIKTAKVNGEEPSHTVADIMKKFDVIIAVTTKSISHTLARHDATKLGARIASMPNITKDMFNRAILLNYTDMKKITLKLKKILDKGNIVNIKTKLGTDLTFKLKNRISIPDYGDLTKKGSFDNLPSGECFIAPIENSANGTYIVDASMGVKLNSPVKITFKNGIATKFSGKESYKIKKQFIGMPKKAFTIAEFGIGTNKKAKIIGKTLEDEKVFGTCHIALGNNIGFGGKTNVPIHIDGVIKKPTIKIDNKIIIKEGKLC